MVYERRSGLARGIYNRLCEDGWFPSRQILGEAQWRLNARIPAGGFSAYQMAFGSNTADLFGWEDDNEDIAGRLIVSGQSFAIYAKFRK